VETLAKGRYIYVSGKRVVSVELVPSKYRYRVRLVYEDGSDAVMYPSVLASRHIEIV